MDGLLWKTLLNLMIWGYPYFWKHPYLHIIIVADCSTIRLEASSLGTSFWFVYLGSDSNTIFVAHLHDGTMQKESS